MYREVGVPGNPAHLSHHGPIMPVRIGPGLSPGQLSTENALVDTGARVCCIDERLAARLALIPVGRKIVRAANVQGKRPTRMFRAFIQAQGDGPTLLSPWRFMAFPIRENMGPDFQVIIGRDVLQRFVLRYDGLTGSVRLTKPVIV